MERLGDGGNFNALAGQGRQFVQGFRRNDGGVHVGDKNLFAPPRQRPGR
jgi:hypothetical protein